MMPLSEMRSIVNIPKETLLAMRMLCHKAKHLLHKNESINTALEALTTADNGINSEAYLEITHQFKKSETLDVLFNHRPDSSPKANTKDNEVNRLSGLYESLLGTSTFNLD